MNSAGLHALVINPGPSLVYLTGLHFHLSERPTTLVIAPPHPPALIVPQLESDKARAASIPLQLFPFGDNPTLWNQAFQAAAHVCGLEGKKIGVEPTRLRFLEMKYLQTAARSAAFISAEPILSALRIGKDEVEIGKMRKAARIAQQALQDVLPMVKPGITERQMAAELVIALLRNGSSSELPFPPIVAFGANSANPHALPTDRQLNPGDLVLFDWGANYADYFSDITRTFALGDPGEELRRAYQLVQSANAAGRAAGKPGLAAGEIDNAARAIIITGGYGDYFTHRTGHGLGMESHEPPYLFAENQIQLQTGMVYTVEPGIYLPGIGGVRIEDDIVVTPDGCESLTDFPRDLTIL
jgi:Xaa-Pro dipeptidase